MPPQQLPEIPGPGMRKSRGLALAEILMAFPIGVVVWSEKHQGAEVIQHILRSLLHFAIEYADAVLNYTALVVPLLLVDWIAGPFHVIESLGSLFEPSRSPGS
jgi:hypothetical protein